MNEAGPGVYEDNIGEKSRRNVMIEVLSMRAMLGSRTSRADEKFTST
jgi:hypothetical protein